MVSTADLRKQLEREKKIAKKEAERREIKRELKTLKRRKIISFGRAVGRGGRVAGKAAGAFGKGVSKVIQAIPDLLSKFRVIEGLETESIKNLKKLAGGLETKLEGESLCKEELSLCKGKEFNQQDCQISFRTFNNQLTYLGSFQFFHTPKTPI